MVSFLHLAFVGDFGLCRCVGGRGARLRYAVLPDGGQIVYQLQGDMRTPADIYTMDMSRAMVRLLYTDNSRLFRNLTWSPDGSRIGFESTVGGSNEIYVMDADGGNPRRLTDHWVPSDFCYAWSPDGRRIVFVSSRTSNYELYVVDVEQGAFLNLTNHPANDQMPAWSPDGSRIAFFSNRDGAYKIHTIQADGTNVRLVTDYGVAPVHSQIAWSPDGTQIAFVSFQASVSDLYVVNADGSNLRRLTTDNHAEYDFAWSPDGRQIAFWAEAEGQAAIYSVNADGTGLQQIIQPSPTGGLDTLMLAWLPTGDRIVFGMGDPEASGYFLVDADGGRVEFLNQSETYGDIPMWRP